MNINDSLYHHIDQLLKNIIMPEFKSFSNDYYIDDISDIGDNVKFLCRFIVDLDEIIPNNHDDADYTSNDFLKSFLQIYPSALKNITKKMSPVSDKNLNDTGLSEEQFVIQLISLNIYPEVRVYQEKNEVALFTKEIFIELVLNIEDITELHPGGLQMLYIKYNNLCQDNSRYSLTELKEWVENLGYKTSTKQQMCRIIKNHYNF